MAKAAKISDKVDTGDPQTWLAEVLRVRFDEVLKFCDAALDASQTDGVHDMRVAIRRLRSVLRDFPDSAGKRPTAAFIRSLKQLADTLGRVRDLDVLIEELEKISEDPECPVRKGVEQIVAIYKDRRIAARRTLENFLTGEFVLELRTRFSALIESASRQRGLFEVADVRDEGRQAIARSLEEFLGKSEAIYHPSKTKRLHKLRIMVKRLRYAIELFAPHFDEPLKPFTAQIKQMQSHLGDLHDCDVWLDEVRTHIPPKRRKPEDPKPPAAIWLISEFARRRTKAYRDALELWSEWEETNFGSRLGRVAAGQRDTAPALTVGP